MQAGFTVAVGTMALMLLAGCNPGNGGGSGGGTGGGPGGATHLGQAYESHVVLEAAHGDTGCISSTAGTTFRRIFQDGNGALQPFHMPQDMALVATDIDWQYHHPSDAAAAGERVVLRVFVQNLADPNERERVFESTITLNGTGEGGTSEAMTSGFVVAPTAQICVDTGENPLGPPFGLQHMILRGYFIAAD